MKRQTVIYKIKMIAMIFAFAIPFASKAQYPFPLNGTTPDSLPPYYNAFSSKGVAGNAVSYAYTVLGTPTNDTLRITAFGNTYQKTLVYVSHNLILLFDSTGDTAAYSNYPNGKATKWYKKNPFLLANQLDQTDYIFINTSTSSNFKVTVPWYNNGLAGDTIHVPKYVSSTGAGGTFVTSYYIYQRGGTNGCVVWKPYSTW